MSNCAVNLAKAGLSLADFDKSDSSYAACRAAAYCAGYSPENAEAVVHQVVMKSRFGDRLEKAVQGGLRHVLSVDNAANYAELWYKGGSWYAVTGATKDENGETVKKGGIYEIAGISKGMPLREASSRFLEAVFGPMGVAKGCGCGG